MRRDEDRTAGAIDVARGRAVGSLERALALTMVLLGDYAAVGWIIAAKSLARFKQLEDREFAEYFLVGTLRSEEHTSELQSRLHLVCRLLLEKKKTQKVQLTP